MTTSLDASALAAFRRRLEQRRTELTSLIEEGRQADQPVSPDKAIGRLTRQDALQQQQMSAELIRRYEQERVLVEQALDAMDAGTYGRCQRCDEPIAVARLDAMPHARICIRCAGGQARDRR
jgi:DnaK suppressor protein